MLAEEAGGGANGGADGGFASEGIEQVRRPPGGQAVLRLLACLRVRPPACLPA